MELKYNNWNDITVNVFERLKAIKIESNDILDELNTNISILSVLCDVDEDTIANLEVGEFNRLLNQTSFLAEMPKAKIQDKYVINGKQYEVHLAINQMSMAQYIDFQTFCKEKDKYMKNIIACFLIPKGKKYGEGYEIEDVLKDIGDMSIVNAHSIMFFFIISFRALTKTMLTYLVKKMRKEMKKEKNIEIVNKMKEAISQIEVAMTLVENGDGLIG